MCSYIGIKVSKEQYIKLKQIEKQIGIIATLKTLQSGFEYKDWAIIKKSDKNKEEIDIINAHWEFIPPWIKTQSDLVAKRKQGIPWFNATAENLLSSKMFRPAALERRCLIPVSHFFEWRQYKHVGGKPIKYPYCIGLKNENIFFLAGIYQPWLNEETGESKNTFAIITTKANEKMAAIHNTKLRMPTILENDLAYEWIMNDLSETQINKIAGFQISSNSINTFTIAKDFRISENPLQKFDYEGLKPLE